MHKYEMETKGHKWVLNTYDNEVDIFGYEEGHHNGPKCELCGYGFCHHCQDLPEEECRIGVIEGELSSTQKLR